MNNLNIGCNMLWISVTKPVCRFFFFCLVKCKRIAGKALGVGFSAFCFAYILIIYENRYLSELWMIDQFIFHLQLSIFDSDFILMIKLNEWIKTYYKVFFSLEQFYGIMLYVLREYLILFAIDCWIYFVGDKKIFQNFVDVFLTILDVLCSVKFLFFVSLFTNYLYNDYTLLLFQDTVTSVFKDHPGEDRKWSLKGGALCSQVKWVFKSVIRDNARWSFITGGLISQVVFYHMWSLEQVRLYLSELNVAIRYIHKGKKL